MCGISYIGEGIHHAMEAGKMAAKFVGECLDHGNFDAEVMSIWHDLWMRKFGSDYKWSVTVILIIIIIIVTILQEMYLYVCMYVRKFISDAP